MAKKKIAKKKKAVKKKTGKKKGAKVSDTVRERFVQGEGVPMPTGRPVTAPVGLMDGIEVIRPIGAIEQKKLISGPGPEQGFIDPEIGREMGPTAPAFILESYVSLSEHSTATIRGAAQIIGLIAAGMDVAEPDIMGSVLAIDSLIRRMAVFRNSLLTHLE
jgi:hypothetical protein